MNWVKQEFNQVCVQTKISRLFYTNLDSMVLLSLLKVVHTCIPYWCEGRKTLRGNTTYVSCTFQWLYKILSLREKIIVRTASMVWEL